MLPRFGSPLIKCLINSQSRKAVPLKRVETQQFKKRVTMRTIAGQELTQLSRCEAWMMSSRSIKEHNQRQIN